MRRSGVRLPSAPPFLFGMVVLRENQRLSFIAVNAMGLSGAERWASPPSDRERANVGSAYRHLLAAARSWWRVPASRDPRGQLAASRAHLGASRFGRPRARLAADRRSSRLPNEVRSERSSRGEWRHRGCSWRWERRDRRSWRRRKNWPSGARRGCEGPRQQLDGYRGARRPRLARRARCGALPEGRGEVRQ